ncbi:DUF6868 family protein [Amaricoccus solimangrovi]|uniref:DUF6868 domain-containing protein n=1 Tax=Amaricoccus solimangrovi TaxID=2589815 RepID=A0A501X1B8_9RHOB|nr:hypothetical protein [Amaricoccus solimangrovi]TPE53636.1 hypothetical protein FJM51_00875 [Amaricoccus solimangrovi]
MTLAQVTAVFGWMTVINLAVYAFAAACVILGGDRLAAFQSRLMGVPPSDWPRLYVDYLGRYKIAIMVFNLAPWLALRIVG